jgi:hypothetical protein
VAPDQSPAPQPQDGRGHSTLSAVLPVVISLRKRTRPGLEIIEPSVTKIVAGTGMDRNNVDQLLFKMAKSVGQEAPQIKL